MPYILSLGVFGGMSYFKNPLQVKGWHRPSMPCLRQASPDWRLVSLGLLLSTIAATQGVLLGPMLLALLSVAYNLHRDMVA
jgi:hypothetical protein